MLKFLNYDELKSLNIVLILANTVNVLKFRTL